MRPASHPAQGGRRGKHYQGRSVERREAHRHRAHQHRTITTYFCAVRRATSRAACSSRSTSSAWMNSPRIPGTGTTWSGFPDIQSEHWRPFYNVTCTSWSSDQNGDRRRFGIPGADISGACVDPSSTPRFIGAEQDDLVDPTTSRRRLKRWEASERAYVDDARAIPRTPHGARRHTVAEAAPGAALDDPAASWPRGGSFPEQPALSGRPRPVDLRCRVALTQFYTGKVTR